MTEVRIPFKGTNYHSHRNHNPDCDILEGYLDLDSLITYGVYIRGSKKGQEFCEYYRGENYRMHSKKRSYSRCWKPTNIPVKYFTLWQLLRSIYENIETK